MNVTEILDRAFSLRIAVVGDLIHDKYIDGVIDRISPEAPVPILRITGTRENWGGAGNVVRNLEGLGCNVEFFYDKNNRIEKTRVMSGNHHILRIDDEEEPRWMQWAGVDPQLIHGIKSKEFDCVVLSDYGKGMISYDVAYKLIGLCNDNNIPTVVDTKKQLHIMRHATLVKCNHKEFEAQRPNSRLIVEWMKDFDIHHMVVTNGERGITYTTVNGDFIYMGNIIGIPVVISDVCGAGDTVTAVLAVCLAQSKDIDSIEDACNLANIAAAEVCKHPGVYPIKREDLLR